MKSTKKVWQQLLGGVFAGSLVTFGVLGANLPAKVEVKADAASVHAEITGELTAKRSQFTKQFAMSDGSFTAATYSMPVHYKKNGKWKEINTTLKKSGKKGYKTKSTALTIKVSRKANRKSVISLKRGKTRLSIALQGKKLKAAKAKISNPKKKKKTDVLNQNTVAYKKVLKNTSISYDIFPEKLQEIVSVTKKQKGRALSFKIDSGKLKVKVKGKKVCFKTKKGKSRYTRLSTKLTDARGASTTKIKLSYNRKKGVLRVTPDKKWWNSKKRKFPMEVRTTYITDKHTRDVKVGAAYAGAPNSNFSYDKSLLLQAGKCIAFTKMTSLAELSQPNVQIRDAALHVKSEKTLKLGAGKTFDIGIHKVTQNWNGKKLTYNNRPAYEASASAVFGIQKKGNYQCDVTDIVKAWYGGEANYGVALVADNSNRSYQAKLDRNPYFTVHYEVVGFEGAVELKENQDITREVVTAGQENYYYFDAKPGIAYDLYTTSTLDTQGTLYDADKNRLGYDDNSGLENNFAFVQSYDGRRYLKVGTKGTATGSYTLSLRKRFAVPVLTGKEGQDSYIVSWNAIDKAKEYLVTIYDAGGRIGDAIVTETSYEYVYTNETAGKTLAFTVTPRENAELTGEESRRIYNTNRDSKWHYDTPMLQSRINFASTVCGGKIYVLGGEDKDTSAVFRDLEVFEPEKQTWTKVSEYPGNAAGTRDAGIVNARMVTVGGKLYVFGGQTDTSTLARTIKEAYCYDPDSARWTRLADLSEGRTEMPVTVLDGKIYIFAKAGSTERVDVYDPKEDTWSSDVKADTSTNLQARTVDGRIFVLREKEAENKELPAKMYWEEYLPETGEYDNAGEICSFANADQYLSGAVVNGKIYMVNNRETSQVICYDVYLDQWSQLSVFNLKKSCSKLQSVGTTLYSLGGFMQGFGTLDVVEAYELETVQITKQLEVVKGEDYELQVDAGNCEEDTDYLVTVRIDPSVLSFSRTSSFMQRKKFEQGRDGIQLVHYAPKKGVIVVKLRGKMETGDTIQAYQSIPAAGLKNETTVVSMEIQNGKKQ